jgi:hypothetical protein
LQLAAREPIFWNMSQYVAKHDLSPAPEPELAPVGAPLHVSVAPGLLDKDYVVIRSDEDTDKDYEARQAMFTAVLAYAQHQG